MRHGWGFICLPTSHDCLSNAQVLLGNGCEQIIGPSLIICIYIYIYIYDIYESEPIGMAESFMGKRSES